MSPADIQQVNEFMRWLGQENGIGPEAVRHLCAFFYGRDIDKSVSELRLDQPDGFATEEPS